jgi:DNA polymerase
MSSVRLAAAAGRVNSLQRVDHGRMAATAPTSRRNRELARLRREAANCRACGLWRCATQTVFGEGPPDAEIMLVGEQPGDYEDREGKPFVGPGGRLLDRALEQAGIDRSMTYRTNVVKHFKYRMRGKRRIHQRPNQAEISACRRWLDAELEIVEPEVLVCLGAVAAHALLGPRASVTKEHGRPLPSDLAPAVLLTTHPASVLRQRDSPSRHAAFDALVKDLEAARAQATTRKLSRA